MKYVSTKGAAGLSFVEVVLSGYCARDGGLVWPERVPVVTDAQLLTWQSLSYEDLLVEICTMFVDADEVSRDEWRTIAATAMRRFRNATPVSFVSHASDNVLLMELFNGPTFAFKVRSCHVAHSLRIGCQ